MNDYEILLAKYKELENTHLIKLEEYEQYRGNIFGKDLK